MDDNSALQEDRLDAGERYMRELADFAAELRDLRLDCGNPSLRNITSRARQIGEKRLVHNTVSEVFKGARLPRLELLLTLVRTLMAYDEDGQHCPAPPAGSPKLKVWRSKWRALEVQRAVVRPARSQVATRQGSAVPEGERAQLSGESGAPEDEGSSMLAAAQRQADGIKAVAAARSEEVLASAQADRDQAAADLARVRDRAAQELAAAREAAQRERERAAADAERIREQAAVDAARVREQAAKSEEQNSVWQTGKPSYVEDPAAGKTEEEKPTTTGGRMAGGNFQDIVDAFFPYRNRTARGRRGVDAEIQLDVSLDEIVFGANKEIQVDTAVVCTVCGGNGAAPGTLPQTCDKCEGRGEVTQVVKSFLGETPTQRPCQQCSGFGTVLPTPCFECTGDGRVRARRTLTLRIPAGVNNADRLQFAGEGEVGPGGGPPADLYVEVRESAHPVFQRQADDLHCTLTVPMTTAILGATIPLETFDGIRNISVPPGAQTGELIRLRNLGVTQQGGKSRGELVIQIQVTTPTRVDVEQEQLIRQFAALRGEERTNHQGRFSRPPDTLNGP